MTSQQSSNNPPNHSAYQEVSRKLNSRGQAVAACFASACNTLLSYPLEVVRTRFQATESKSLNTSTWRTLITIGQTEGVRGLYKGVTLGLVGGAVAWASYMYMYAELKNGIEKRGFRLDSPQVAGASLVAGFGTMLLTNPIWMIKTRLQLDGARRLKNPAHVPYKGIIDAVRTTVRVEGVTALYKGLVPALVSTLHGSVQFASYEKILSIAMEANGIAYISGYAAFIAGGVSKVLAMVITYPATVVRTRLQDERGINVQDRKYKGTIDTVKLMFRNEGTRGFYKGLSPSLMKLAFNSALFFLFFEEIKKALLEVKAFEEKY